LRVVLLKIVVVQLHIELYHTDQYGHTNFKVHSIQDSKLGMQNEEVLGHICELNIVLIGWKHCYKFCVKFFFSS
jgi:hypothetical protein